jgi:hypothetical protein
LAASLVSIFGLGGTHFKFVSDALTLVLRDSAMSFAPAGPIPLLEASMVDILLTVLLQTAPMMAAHPSSPSELFLRSSPPSPILVRDALTFRASASDFAPSEPMSLCARLSYKQEAREADTVSVASKTRSARVGELGGADKKRAPVSTTR